MRIQDVRLLFDYNYWARDRILNAAERVTSEQFTQPAGSSHGSLRGTLVHCLSAEWLWRMRMTEVPPRAGLSEANFPDLTTLRARWDIEENAMRCYLDSLTDADLDAPLFYATTSGEPRENILWQALSHVVNHGTQCRSEAAMLLTSYGQSPGDIDLILYLRTR